MVTLRKEPLGWRIFRSRIFSVIVLVVLVGTVRATWNVYHKANEAYGRSEESERLHERLSERHTSLTAHLAELASEEGVERELRRKFRVAERGEQIIILTREASTVEASTVRDTQVWWKRFFGFFTE